MSTKTFKFIVNVDTEPYGVELNDAFDAVWDAIEAVLFVTDASGEVQN